MSKVQVEFASAYFSCRRVEWMVSSLRVECRLRSSLSGMHVAFVLLNALRHGFMTKCTVDHVVPSPLRLPTMMCRAPLRLSTMTYRPHSDCRPWCVVLTPTADHGVSSFLRLSTMTYRLHPDFRPWCVVCTPATDHGPHSD